MPGKLNPEQLRDLFFSFLGKKDETVIIGPQIGEDAAVIQIDPDTVLVIHTDPITGAQENIGWLSVHIVANDISVRGVKPRWLLPVILLPEGLDTKIVRKIAEQIDLAAKEIDAAIVGGHTEYTAGIDRPIISMTAVGIGKKSSFIATRNAKVGDLVLMTKTAAIEGTAILAHDFYYDLREAGVNEKILSSARQFISKVSVVREALLLADKGDVNSMHDPTEGGILGGLLEIAYASGTTIYVYEELIPIAEETKIICDALKVDPYKLISSGVLLATLPRDKVEENIKVLRNSGLRAEIIGEVKKREGPLVVWLKKKSEKELYNYPFVEDELFRLIKERQYL